MQSYLFLVSFLRSSAPGIVECLKPTRDQVMRGIVGVSVGHHESLQLSFSTPYHELRIFHCCNKMQRDTADVRPNSATACVHYTLFPFIRNLSAASSR